MSKDPAILFYTSDFLAQCTSLTMEERGEYITLIPPTSKGHLDQKTLSLQFNQSGISDDVLNLFAIDENECIYSEWLEEIIIKRKAYAESRRKNRKGKTKNK